MIMRHFEHLSEEEQNEIFFKKPMQFDKNANKELLPMALGATMYTPATDKKMAQRIIDRKYKELACNVWCLEDAIGEDEVADGVLNLFKQVHRLKEAIKNNEIKTESIPLIFIRVRSVEQLESLLKRSHILNIITGFNLPKFSSINGERYLSLIEDANRRYNTNFYAMPILESSEVMYQETRREELIKVKTIIDGYRDMVLNIRLGGTDFSSLFGMRRGIDFTIYDISVINNCISDIVNLFGRATENYTISGVVWEYFPDSNRMLKPQLRETPFLNNKGGTIGIEKREEIITKEIDGLIKEIILDKANGMTGKTIIHPSHIRYVNALQVVTYEEYIDALKISGSKDSGVFKSKNGNKMNEVKPHTNWANKILKKAEIYGVLNEEMAYIDLF